MLLWEHLTVYRRDMLLIFFPLYEYYIFSVVNKQLFLVWELLLV